MQKNSEKRFTKENFTGEINNNASQYIQQCRMYNIFNHNHHTLIFNNAGLFKKWRLSKKLWKQWIEYQGNFPLPLEQNNILHNIYCILQHPAILQPTANITIFAISYGTIYNIFLQLWRKD